MEEMTPAPGHDPHKRAKLIGLYATIYVAVHTAVTMAAPWLGTVGKHVAPHMHWILAAVFVGHLAAGLVYTYRRREWISALREYRYMAAGFGLCIAGAVVHARYDQNAHAICSAGIPVAAVWYALRAMTGGS